MALELEAVLRAALDEGRLERSAAVALGERLDDAGVREAVLDAAIASKRAGHGDVITVSRNVFLPLTNLCRDRCTYCTFAKPEDSPEAHTYSLDEVAEVTRGGVATGCIEALFCLGDKPERAWRGYRAWLAREGWGSTAAYLQRGCQVAFEGGLLPHTNAGILSRDEMAALRPWNASMGLMLESTSQRLRGKGMPHFHAPDKDPAVRLRMHEEAGELAIPFTSGILIGIGEDAAERVDTLLAIRDLHDRLGHVQEVIVQPFHPKPGTAMRWASPLPEDDVAGWVALARLVLGPHMHLQAPPNLAPGVLPKLLRSGLDDWGGVSPLTVDYINPEAPWPTLEALRRATEDSGQELRERLPVYPEYVRDPERWLDPQVRAVLPRFADAEGYARPWRARREEAA